MEAFAIIMSAAKVCVLKFGLEIVCSLKRAQMLMCCLFGFPTSARICKQSMLFMLFTVTISNLHINSNFSCYMFFLSQRFSIVLCSVMLCEGSLLMYLVGSCNSLTPEFRAITSLQRKFADVCLDTVQLK